MIWPPSGGLSFSGLDSNFFSYDNSVTETLNSRKESAFDEKLFVLRTTGKYIPKRDEGRLFAFMDGYSIRPESNHGVFNVETPTVLQEHPGSKKLLGFFIRCSGWLVGKPPAFQAGTMGSSPIRSSKLRSAVSRKIFDIIVVCKATSHLSPARRGDGCINKWFGSRVEQLVSSLGS